MFLHLCVILFTGGLCPSMHHRSHNQGAVCPGGSVQVGVSVQGSLSGGLCPGGSLSKGVSVQGVSVQGVSAQGQSLPGGSLSGYPCPGGSLSRGSLSGESLSRVVSVQGVSKSGPPSRGVSVWVGLCWAVSVRETSHTVTSGLYASYWNAFLSILLSLLQESQNEIFFKRQRILMAFFWAVDFTHQMPWYLWAPFAE